MQASAQSENRPAGQEVVPVVVVSQCLGFAAVRYNGQVLHDAFVSALHGHVRFVQVCPEVGIGLGVPRDPIRIVVNREGRRLVQPATGRELSHEMVKFADGFLSSVGPVDGFILKSRSPSCGIKDVKTFSEEGHPAPKSAGFFAEAVRRWFPHAPAEDEGRLTNFRLRHHFLTSLFMSARFREAMRAGTMAALVEFHTRYKLQLMAYSQAGLRELGRLVANAAGHDPGEVLHQYRTRLTHVLHEAARPASLRNALLHAFGYVSKTLAAREKAYFLELLEEYRHERLPLTAILTVLQSWVLRFEQPYLLEQRFFEPYPKALMELTDSAAGKPAE